jgi:hypothetical protein
LLRLRRGRAWQDKQASGRSEVQRNWPFMAAVRSWSGKLSA